MPTATKSDSRWSDAPFSTKLDTRRFYPGVSQEESLSRMHFLVENRRRLGVFTGPVGCGKSLLLEVAARQFRQQNHEVGSFSLTGVDYDEFLWKLAAELGGNPEIDASARQLWRDINDRISANRYQRISTILMFDDVEDAETEVISAIVRLAQSDLSGDSRLTIVVASESSRSHLLGPRLMELCDLRIELESWSAEEVASFVATSLAATGCSPDLFTEASLERLTRLSAGVPRRVQQLAQLALVAGEAQDLDQIDESTLEAVHEELSATSWC